MTHQLSAGAKVFHSNKKSATMTNILRDSLTEKEREYLDFIATFATAEIAPQAERFDTAEHMPAEMIEKLRQAGLFGANVATACGGAGLSAIEVGLMHHEVGRACSSVRSILTVHGMVCEAIHRWGNQEQRDYWLPQLGAGKILAAFGLTEPNAGSDAAAIESDAVRHKDSYHLVGEKRWTTAGQIADVFLVLAKTNGKHTAFLLDRNTPGLTITPTRGMLGLRGAMLATLHIDNCVVSDDRRLAREGFGWSTVGATALDFGRYTVAWGCAGIAESCLQESLRHSASRKQFGEFLRKHQLVGAMIAEMVTKTRAARLLCMNAAKARMRHDSGALLETCVAKYFSAKTCAEVASDAVQIHGALGCSMTSPVQRYYRDAKIMEIIEGSTQMQQVLISGLVRPDQRRIN